MKKRTWSKSQRAKFAATWAAKHAQRDGHPDDLWSPHKWLVEFTPEEGLAQRVYETLDDGASAALSHEGAKLYKCTPVKHRLVAVVDE